MIPGVGKCCVNLYTFVHHKKLNDRVVESLYGDRLVVKTGACTIRNLLLLSNVLLMR